MAKGGRYLNKDKSGKKKGHGWKIALIVLAILAVLLGAAGIYAVSVYNDLLGSVKRAEVVEQNQDLSYDDLIAEMFGSSGE